MEMEQAYCLNCEHPIHEIGLLQPEVRPRRRPKSQLQRCPSCHYSLEVPKHSSGKTKCYKNMETILDRYADYLTCPTNQRMNLPQSQEESLIRVTCGHGTSNAYHHSRKRQTSGLRPQRRSEDEQIFLPGNADGCCIHPQHAENGCFHDDWQEYKSLVEELRKRREPRGSRQRRKDDIEDETIRCRRKPGLEDLSRCKLGLDLSRYDSTNNAEAVGDDLDDRRTHQKLYNDTKVGRGTDDHDYTKERFPRSRTALNAERKSRKRSVVRNHTVCRPEDESTNRGESTFEEEDQDQDARKNLYAGGDLNLRATKSVIVGLIDKALSHTFGSPTDQTKNVDSTRGLAKEEPSIEVVRALQGDCCESLKDLLTHRGLKQDYIKDLKLLRSEHMNHIRNMFSKLCNLQQFLDSCSPRLSMSAPQTLTAAVEQRVEERQQQPHEEK
ncbi:uncharacterized protein LOC143215696 isoform X2 [Lasioglossum baleicum]|uniref:uncharacterized protein LOC143215696 isoform X2 n=1 Tax=Lasioglossum baleicum TaxID=434251 RepID=UPI003FCE1FB0